MADRFNLAQQNLNRVSAYVDGLLDGFKRQVDDVQQIAKEALQNRSYPADRFVPDMVALWLNGAGVMTDALLGGRRSAAGAGEAGKAESGGSGGGPSGAGVGAKAGAGRGGGVPRSGSGRKAGGGKR